MSMTDSCFIDDTSSKNTACHTWLILPRHPAAVAAVSVGLAHAPAPMSTLVLLFAWLATISWDAFYRYVWLAGWSHAGRVCLSDASCARDQRKPCSQSRPSVCTHSNGPAHELTRRGYGSIYTKFTKLDRLKVEIVLILVIITAVTDSQQSPKITVQGENHGNHGDCDFVIYIHPYVLPMSLL